MFADAGVASISAYSEAAAEPVLGPTNAGDRASEWYVATFLLTELVAKTYET